MTVALHVCSSMVLCSFMWMTVREGRRGLKEVLRGQLPENLLSNPAGFSSIGLINQIAVFVTTIF